jgi:hypothetical protein
MLTSIEGTYRNGQIELKEPPADVPGETPVIVTFMSSSDIDLRRQGINQPQAAELYAALSTFEDWNEPEMDIYNDYDATKSNL